MSRTPPRPPLLRRQLLTWLLVPLFVLLGADTLLSYGVALEFSRRAYDRSLVEIARDLSLHLRRDSSGVTVDLPAEARKILFEDADDRIYHAVGPANSPTLAGDDIPAAPSPPAAGRPESYYEAIVAGAPVRVVELHVPANSRGAPAAVVRVAETLNRRNALAREILLAVVLPQALLLLVAGVIVWVGVAHGLAPIERLRRALAARSHRDWSPVDVHDVPGEVRPLLEAINELVAGLDQALTLNNRFIADAAHQLKTPITVLKANLELALREEEPARARQSLEAAHAGLERLSRTVSQLLSLARNEPHARPQGPAAHAALDLNAFALEAASAWVPAAIKRHIDLGFEAAPGVVPIRGDATQLRELLDNLVDNAVRYTPEGGRVTVRVESVPPAVHVDDDGPRIPAAEREAIFGRFHRLLGDRTAGTGLGLAIAQEIALAHGATITLSDDDDGVGNTFRVSFPVS